MGAFRWGKVSQRPRKPYRLLGQASSLADVRGNWLSTSPLRLAKPCRAETRAEIKGTAPAAMRFIGRAHTMIAREIRSNLQNFKKLANLDLVPIELF